MSTTELGEAQVPIRATLDKLDGDLAKARGKVEGAIQGLVGNIQKIGKAALGIGGAGVTAIAGIGAAVGKMAIDAAPVEGLESAFAGLSESAGVGMDNMLAALKKGSAGMVANRDLMMSFNQAASLVSLDFAKQLPDAMSYLGKVSASTGQDMGFLLDSLVKGVGRLSPMILDNLAIQVSQSEATERAAQMFGVEAEALSKAQQQAGMMNVVLEKLAANTAAMPDVSESAAARMAQLKATFQDTKDEIGMAFLPTLTALAGVLANVAEQVLPLVTQALDVVAPIVEKVAGAFDTFVTGLLAGADPIAALTVALYQLFPPEVAQPIVDAIRSVRDWIQEVIDVVAPYVEIATQWIGENVKLQDVLIGLGIAIASVVVPAVVSLLAPVLAIIATAAALIGIIAALRTAWETDWMGIRTTLTDFWENTAKPALEDLWAWLEVNIPAAIETLRSFWEETLWPALQAVWSWTQEHLVPLFEAINELLGVTLSKTLEALAGLWQNVLQPALEDVWEFIQENLLPILERLGEFLDETLKKAFEGISTAIKDVTGWIKDLAGKIASLELPDWLTPGSPTPFELALRGIGEEMERLSKVRVPALNASLGGAADNSRHFEFNLYGGQIDRQSVFGAYETIRAMETA